VNRKQSRCFDAAGLAAPELALFLAAVFLLIVKGDL